MEKEISSGTMLGIVLIALAVIVGLGFGIFQIAKGVANTGMNNLTSSLNTVAESEFKDYDQTVVTGQQVLSAYNTFEGRDVAVLIANQNFLKNNRLSNSTVTATADLHPWSNYDTGSSSTANYYMKINTTADTTGSNLVKPSGDTILDQAGLSTASTWLIRARRGADSGTAPETTTVNYRGNAVTALVTYCNYNAKLDYASGIYKDDGVYISNGGLAVDAESNVCFNTQHPNLTKSGTNEYVSTTSKYKAYMINDSSGTHIGVAFIQLSR